MTVGTSVIVEALRPLAAPIDNLQADPENARRGDIAAIRTSLNVFGQRKPIVVKRTGSDAQGRPTGIVIAGNHTYFAACELAWTHIAAVFVDDDASTARAYALADNRTGELATWDDEQLAATLRELAADDFDMSVLGWTNDDLAELLGIGPAGSDAFGEPGDDDADEPIEGLIYPHDLIADTAMEHYRAAGFPYPNMPKFAAMQEINALAALDTDKLSGTPAAYHVADPYQPHRFATPVQGKATPIESFGRDDKLRHAMVFNLETRKLTDSALLSALSLVRNTQCAAQFRPGFALLMYRRFAPAGGTVLDTSAGFGGRLIGFIASSCSTYIGIDPNTVTDDGNRRIAADLCPADKTVELHCQPAEDVPHKTVAGRADFAFTSPPYFAKERYSDEPSQSCVRYPTADGWRSGFLVPMLALQYAALKPGAHSCINIADVKIGGDTVPLVEWTIESACAAGFEYVRTEKFPLPRVPGSGTAAEGFEAVIVLRRPEGRKR